MYTRFFGLKQEPFSLAPDPRYLYMSKRHREALAHLLYGVGGGGGFVLLSGEIGAGKTTVCRCFLEQIPKRCNVAYIFNPKLTAIELVKSVCDEFHIPTGNGRGEPTVKTYVDALNEFLLATHAVGQNNVLIIDEAQQLSVEVLEQLRLLTNLETNERKLLQIVLIGQPELRTMLERPDLEQLAQRVIARFHLKALSERETEHYIRHRLSVAGMTRTIPFDKKALKRIHEIARGVPRRINLLCDRAMLGAYAHGQAQIDAAVIEKAAREVFGRSEQTGADHSRLGLGIGIGLVIAAGLGIVAMFVFGLYGGYSKLAAPAVASAPMAASAASARARANAAAGVAPAASTGGASATALTNAAVAGPTAGDSARRPMAGVAGTDAIGSAPVVPGARSGENASAPASNFVASHAPPVAAVASASTPLPADGAAGTVLDVAALKAQLKSWGRDEKSAWRELAAMWSIAPLDGDACAAAALQRVRCAKFTSSLAMLRSLGRPGFMTLRDETHATHVVLVGLGYDNATLLAGDGTHVVSLQALGKLWQGEFGTLWRMPPGYANAVAEGASGPLVDQLAAQLAALAGEPAPVDPKPMDATLRARLTRFQAEHGISKDGVAGPTTFMQLNRAAGVDEPKLLAGAGAR